MSSAWEKESLLPAAGSVNQLYSRDISPPVETSGGDVANAPPIGKKIGRREFWSMLVILVALTVGDTVLIAVLMYHYTDTFALFVNQGTALVYGLVSIPIVLMLRRRARRKEEKEAAEGANNSRGGSSLDSRKSLDVPPEKPSAPWYWLLVIGVMNGTGNFCSAIGQPHTRGDTQALILLLGVPMVMFFSWIVLKQRPSFMAFYAACFIVAGVVISSLPSLLGSSSDAGFVSLWYSVVIFFCSELFFSGEKVMEEVVFHKYRTDVFYMFLWTLWTQFVLGWIYYPLQAIPEFGNITLSSIPDVIWNGCKCTAGLSAGPGYPHCDWHNPVLFFVYCAVDYCCYAYGLYVIQRGGANLMVLASAIAIPLTQLVFAIKPLMGPFWERFEYTDAIALGLTLIGFILYKRFSPEGRARIEQ